MNHHGFHSLLALLLCLLILTGCGTGAAPAETESTQEPATEEALPEGAVLVSTVDELLAAIAPNAVIVLQEGEYDLSTASDYGEEDLRGPYRWELVYGGCQLDISDVYGLSLIGRGQVSILARPRYAEVLSFSGCWDLRLENLTLGHTTQPGGCASGVLNLSDCENVSVEDCRLFGCGSMGVTAVNCQSVFLRSTQIDSCSDGAVTANRCKDLRLEDCRLCDCGLSGDYPGGSLIYTERCKGFALVNCEITGNRVNQLLQNQWSEQVSLLGCRVEDNRVFNCFFELQGRSVTVDKCSFQRRSSEDFYARDRKLFAHDPAGEDLISFDLDHMELGRAEYSGPVELTPEEPVRTELPDGNFEVKVSSAEELLAAIAPNTTILLEPGEYDLSAVEGYGTRGGEWYGWEPVYDGYCLTLEGVHDLCIRGAGREQTLVSVSPRYAAVFAFRDCQNIWIAGLTAGHSEEPGYCAGNVLDFSSCLGVHVEDCGLFGCGVLGIWAWNCEGFTVLGSDIYECSSGGAVIDGCEDVLFEGCRIYDCDDGNNSISVFGGTVTWNEEVLREGIHYFDDGFCLG